VETPSWQAAPPPVRRAKDTLRPTAPPTSVPPKPPTVRGKPAEAALPKPPTPEPTPPTPETKNDLALDSTARDVPAPVWQSAPPPVRRAAADAPAEPSPPPPPADDWLAPPVPVLSESAPASKPPAPRRWGTFVIISVLLLVSGGAGAWIWWHGLPDPEEVQRQKLAADFEKASHTREYADIAQGYEKLAREFPESDRVNEYRFYAALCGLLREASSAIIIPETVMEKLRAFAKKWKDDPLLDKNRLKVADIFRRILEKELEAAEKLAKNTPIPSKDLDEIEKGIARTIQWGDEGNPYWIDGNLPPSLRAKIDELKEIVAKARRREAFIVTLKKMAKPTLKDVERVTLEARDLGLDRDSQVTKEIDDLWHKAVPTVEYVRNPEPAREPPAPTPVGMVIAPRLDSNPTPPANPGVVFAMVRGILYALAENDGHVLWATRVGIDTQHLPVRLPPTETTKFEIALVISADNNTLTARRVADGAALWRHALGSPALGRPVVVERRIEQREGGDFLSRRVYIATADGRVQEIEIASGHLLGEYRCGLPLLVGGARQPGSTLLCFPADRGYVFVLDVDEKKPHCVGVLRTGHPSGSLRGEPILVGQPQPNKPDAPPAYLVLCQTDGLEAMRLRAFKLPHSWDGQEPKEESPPEPEDRSEKPWSVGGWLWFAPRCDGEKVVLATDAGVLGLFGINQLNNADTAIFPLLGKKRPTVALGHRGTGGRAQVIHATENDFWVLAHGEAQHWRLGFTRRDGLTLGAEWARPTVLGSPLHAGQVNAAGDTLFVVTQALTRPVCLATALDAATGDIRWQRQLGLVCAHDPLPVGDRVLALDQGGGLFKFDPAQFPADSDKLPVQERLLLSASPLVGNVFFMAGNGTAHIIGSPATGSLIVHRYTAGKKPDETTVQDLTFAQSLAGTPALVGKYLFFPHADGTLRRLELAKGGRVTTGLDWRAEQADPDAPGHIVHLGGDDFLCTDGSRGLFRLSWAANDPVGKRGELKPPQLDRIMAAPLVLPADRVCVADASNTVTLLHGPRLQKERSWDLGGKVTAGPVLRGKHIICILDRRQIVAMDPDQDKPAWTYADPDGAPIVGLPQGVGDRLLVAHLSGKVVSLEGATGQLRGKGFTIRASAAPSAAPAPFGADRVFVPLTDGSVLLVTVDEIESK
jgi:outer membrane protein assembly factor BamB